MTLISKVVLMMLAISMIIQILISLMIASEVLTNTFTEDIIPGDDTDYVANDSDPVIQIHDEEHITDNVGVNSINSSEY
jgi:hypothetical protein